VYLAGDCRAGAATVVRAIADGKAAAASILKKLALEADFSAETARCGSTASGDLSDLYLMKGVIAEAEKDNTDGYRCLSCNRLCEICIDVCPNRANVMVEVQGRHQIVHIDRMCNECGNCAVFCPHEGKPYRDKFTIFSSREDFADSENPGIYKISADTFWLRLEDKSVTDYRRGEANIPDGWSAMIETIEKNYSYLGLIHY